MNSQGELGTAFAMSPPRGVLNRLPHFGGVEYQGFGHKPGAGTVLILDKLKSSERSSFRLGEWPHVKQRVAIRLYSDFGRQPRPSPAVESPPKAASIAGEREQELATDPHF